MYILLPSLFRLLVLHTVTQLTCTVTLSPQLATTTPKSCTHLLDTTPHISDAYFAVRLAFAGHVGWLVFPLHPPPHQY